MAAGFTSFDLAAFDTLVETRDRVLLRVSGRWNAGDGVVVRMPLLRVVSGGGEARLEPLPLPDERSPASTSEGGLWSATFVADRRLIEGPEVEVFELHAQPDVVVRLPQPTPPPEAPAAGAGGRYTDGPLEFELDGFVELPARAPYRLVRLTGRWRAAPGAPRPDLRLYVRGAGRGTRRLAPLGLPAPEWPSEGGEAGWDAVYALPARIADDVPAGGFSLHPSGGVSWDLPPLVRVASTTAHPAHEGAAPPADDASGDPSATGRRMRPRRHAHPGLILATVVASLLGAALYLGVQTPEYRGTAEVLIAPVPENSDLADLPLLRESGDRDKTRATAATLLHSTVASTRAAERLGGTWTELRVRKAISIAVAPTSDLLLITAKAETGRDAARVANRYTAAVLAERNRQLQAPLQREITATIRQLSRIPDPNTENARDVSKKLAQLRALQGRDPTLTLASAARPPDHPIGLPVWARLLVAALGGLVLGIGGGWLLEWLTVRPVRDEQEAEEALAAPVVLRLPPLDREAQPAALSLDRPLFEQFRVLAAELREREPRPRVVLVTSAGEADGKTSCAAALATTLAEGGARVIALDLDLRRPALATRLGAQRAAPGLEELGDGEGVRSALEPAGETGRLAVAGPAQPAEGLALGAMLSRVPKLIADAAALAEWVILDTAPVGPVADTLRALGAADLVLVVVRPGHTGREALASLADALSRANVRDEALIVNGAPRTARRTASRRRIVRRPAAI